MSEIILTSVSGKDAPGITTALSKVLSKYDIRILDIGQSVIHDTLSLGLLIDIPPKASASPVFKDLLLKAHELSLTVRFTPVSVEKYEAWVKAQGQPGHIITLLGRRITARHIGRISDIVASNGLNIEQITRLSGRISLLHKDKSRRASIEFSIRGKVPDLTAMHSSFLQISHELELDISIQEDNVFRRNRRLVCFDMDSTLIQAEVVDEIAKVIGVDKQVSRITEVAMNGEIDFKESFSQRLALLKGVDESVLQRIAEKLPITEGADRLIYNLKRLGFKIAILSGGFTYFAHYLGKKFGIDYVYANDLAVKNGKLTGTVEGEIIDGEKKAELMRQISQKEGLCLDQVIAVGDGANDLPMLSIAGMGVAYHAKPCVRRQAKHSIATLGLDGILYLIGMCEREIKDP